MKNKIILYLILLLILFLVNFVSAMEIILQGSVNETYDDNINTSGSAPESDWLTNIMLGITARSEVRAFDFDFSGHVYQRLSANHAENSSNSQDLAGSFNKDFSENVSFGISDVFQNYPEAGSFGVLFGRGDDNSGYKSNTANINLNIYLTQKLFLAGMYTNGIMKNDSYQLSDSVSHNPGGAIGYSFNTANILRFGYLYQLMKYDNGEKIRGDSGYAQYEKYFTKQLRSLILAGYDYIDSDQGQSLSKRWMASLIDDVDETNQLNITYEYGSAISNILNDILKNWTIRGTLSRQISNRVIMNMSIFYGEGTYEISGIKDKLFGASVNAAYIVTDFINLDIGYIFTWSSSEDPGADEIKYDRNQFSIGLSALY